MKEFKENMKVICMVDDYLNIKKGSIYTVESEIEKDYIFIKEVVGSIHKKDVKIINGDFEEEIKVSEYLAKLGISVFNESGEFRNLEDIIKQCSNIHKIK